MFLPTGREPTTQKKEEIPMIITNKLNGRYYMSEKNATADELITTLVRALDMVIKDIARRKDIDQKELTERVISVLEASGKSDSLLP